MAGFSLLPGPGRSGVGIAFFGESAPAAGDLFRHFGLGAEALAALVRTECGAPERHPARADSP